MKKKQQFDELDFYESALREILGDDEDALQVTMEDMVIPHMNLEYFVIGSTGFAQVGRDDYWEKHDFGIYHEMCLLMEDNNKEHWYYHGKCECLDWDKLEEEIEYTWLQEHIPIPVEDVNHLINPNKL